MTTTITTTTTTTSKHTTGPWTIEFDDDLATIAAPTRDGMVPIATVEIGFTGRIEIEQQANAHLISAAPDLDEALSALVQYAEWQIREGDIHHPTLPSAIAKGRAALAKARGEG